MYINFEVENESVLSEISLDSDNIENQEHMKKNDNY